MKFLLDANIPYSAKEIFKNPESVFHVQDVNLATATDLRIINFAKKNRLVLITKDLDFANILEYPPSKYCGIIVLRVPYYFTAKEINKTLSRFLKSIKDKEKIRNSTTIVEPSRYRMKRN